MDRKSPGDSNDSNERKTSQSEENNAAEQDFFEALQAKEVKEGTSVRGKGHGWSTFIEMLLGDW